MPRSAARFDGDAGGRIRGARIVVCAALVTGIALSLPLWYGPHRLFPAAPVAPLPELPPPGAAALLVAMLAGIALLLTRRAEAAGATVAAAAIAALILCDRERLQPWAFLYAALLVTLTFPAGATNAQRDATRLSASRIVIAATYFWGGLQKANAAFVHVAWPDFASALLAAVPPAAGHAVIAAAPAIPAVEIAIGIGLLIPRVRRIAVVLCIATHVTILALLVWSHENTVIWPWNVALPLLVVLLFWNVREPAPARARQGRALEAVAVLVFGAFPALSLFGWWSPYLSAALYSGNTPQVAVLVDPAAVARLPPVVRTNTWQRSAPNFIDLNRWAYDELNVPISPSIATYRVVGRAVCRRFAGTYAVVILHRPDWRTGVRERSRLACDDAGW